MTPTEPGMTVDERVQAILEDMELRMAKMGVVTTAHYEAGRQLIADAIRAAVAAEREACLEAVTALMGDSGRPDTEEWNKPLAAAADAIIARDGPGAAPSAPDRGDTR